MPKVGCKSLMPTLVCFITFSEIDPYFLFNCYIIIKHMQKNIFKMRQEFTIYVKATPTSSINSKCCQVQAGCRPTFARFLACMCLCVYVPLCVCGMPVCVCGWMGVTSMYMYSSISKSIDKLFLCFNNQLNNHVIRKLI